MSTYATPSVSGHSAVTTFTYQVVGIFPHDTNAFTEGLAFDSGFLYESTGLKGRSSLRRVDLTTGRVHQIYNLLPEYFGEGIAIFRNSIYQLTYTSRTALVFDKKDFALQHQFSYNTEGWGLTQDSSRLIMSDGTAYLYFRDPVTFRELSRLEAHDIGGPVQRLNELEYINGKVYANVWQTDRIAIIDPATGDVTGWIDLSGILLSQGYTGTADVLNGIAYDPMAGRLFVTGKLWPYLFEIKLVPEN